MAGFFSKASSFLNSQADQEAPTHGAKADNDAEPRKPASSGGYGDLLAGAQALMTSSKPSDEGEFVDKEAKSHNAPGSGGYGDLLASAQSFMATAKPSTGGKPVDKEAETDKAPSSGGYGDLLASAQSLMGSTKLSSSEGTPVDKKEGALKTTSSGESGYGDMYASAQVLMGAAKASRDGAAADMGEVADATANLIGGASRYGNLEKTTYGEYAHKAETYLRDYKASHGKASPQEVHKPSAGSEEEGSEPPLSKQQEGEEERSNPQFKNPIRSTEEE